jgi:hypothetical protein
MVGLAMGTGDAWPAVDLAKVQFKQSGPRTFTANQLVVAGPTDAAGLSAAPTGIFAAAPVPGAVAAPPPSGCKPLATGHHRRIFFGFSDTAVNNTFALAYEEVDQYGNVVPGTHYPSVDVDENDAAAPPPGYPTTTGLARFDPSVAVICLPLGAGQSPVTEQWELVQLSTENHNFHLHQTRFTMVGANGGVAQDNFPMGVATPNELAFPGITDQVMNNQNGVCLISQWRNSQCLSNSEVVSIPFTQLGEFVYHCHILEHEDGGMMARIMVVPAAF